ncbi:MAG TPA: hypothetical protein P5556_09905 [Candidatus Gastranaerophilales bacterium]|nr:hypothetical protein [Candidatus Gastranaerophilales bacterium]
MDFKEATDLIWKNRKYKTTSEKEAVSHLNEEVAESLNALLRGDREKAQNELEDALSCMLIAFKAMNIDPETSVLRQIEKMKEHPSRIMHIYSDRVEIRVNNEIKGGWAIWSADDLREAEKMAREFNCEIIKEDRSNQLMFEIPENVTED